MVETKMCVRWQYKGCPLTNSRDVGEGEEEKGGEGERDEVSDYGSVSHASPYVF